VLRSKSPEMVVQEIYGHLLVYYAIRALINGAAEPVGLDPDRLSFTRSLRVIRRQVTDQAAFPPEQLAAATVEAAEEIMERPRTRRLRANPRVIKRKMSKWPLKRAHHRNPVRPHAPPRDTIVITGPSKMEPRRRQPAKNP
jgi:hypothetical protein